jgi:hypothetical protein
MFYQHRHLARKYCRSCTIQVHLWPLPWSSAHNFAKISIQRLGYSSLSINELLEGELSLRSDLSRCPKASNLGPRAAYFGPKTKETRPKRLSYFIGNFFSLFKITTFIVRTAITLGG